MAVAIIMAVIIMAVAVVRVMVTRVAGVITPGKGSEKNPKKSFL